MMTETVKMKGSCSISNVEVLILIDASMCSGCGLCGEVCPFGLPNPDGNGKFEIKKHELCTECSACQRNCPEQAIIMNEVEGCGCLWDARSRKKAEKGGKEYMGCGCAPSAAPTIGCCSSTTSCCEPDDLKDFKIEFID